MKFSGLTKEQQALFCENIISKWKAILKQETTPYASDNIEMTALTMYSLTNFVFHMLMHMQDQESRYIAVENITKQLLHGLKKFDFMSEKQH